MALRESEQKSGGEEVAGPGRVEDVIDGFGSDRHDLVASHDRCAERAPGHDGESTVASNRRDGRLEVLGLVERAQFVLIGEEDVDFVLDESPEVGAMTIDAETVRQRQRHLTSGTVGDPRRVSEGLLGVVTVEEISLHVEDTTGRHHVFVDIGSAQIRRHAEVSVHGSLRIGCDHDDATTSGDVVEQTTGGEVHSDRVKIVTEDVTEIVGTDLADVGGSSAETGDAAHGVGRRATAHLDRRPECPVQMEGPFGVDESHRTLGERLTFDEGVVGVGDDVDQSITDADHVES